MDLTPSFFQLLLFHPYPCISDGLGRVRIEPARMPALHTASHRQRVYLQPPVGKCLTAYDWWCPVTASWWTPSKHAQTLHSTPTVQRHAHHLCTHPVGRVAVGSARIRRAQSGILGESRNVGQENLVWPVQLLYYFGSDC